MEVVIIGAGGFATQIIEVFELTGVKILGLLDDKREEPLLGYPILGKISPTNSQAHSLFCAIGSTSVRRKIYETFPKNWINCIHPTAIVSKFATIGVGNYIGPGACLMPRVTIGDNNILDPLSLLSHDVVLGSHNHVAGHSSILGRVRIGDGNLIGSNSTILPGLVLGDNNILGAGAVCTKSVCNQKIMVGVPARERPEVDQ
jgi:sugar O-acyltransferase (sialic acid O-acetyltransferase NeuD family)